MSMHPLEAILFDLDGVLVDSRHPISLCINHALEALGLEREPEHALHGWIGVSLHQVFSALLAARDADPASIPTAIDHYRERYTVVAPRETPAFEGIPACLETLASRHRLAVATSKPADFAVPILESLGLAGHFEAIVGAPLEGTHHEDKTATVGRTLAALGGGPESPSAAMVGDRHLDIRAGQAHGLLTIGATWGIGGPAELREAGAHHLASTPADLLALTQQGERS